MGTLAFCTLVSCEFGSCDSEAGAHFRGWGKPQGVQCLFLWRPSLVTCQPAYSYSIPTMSLTSKRSSPASRSLKLMDQTSALLRSLSTLADKITPGSRQWWLVMTEIEQRIVVRVWTSKGHCLAPLPPSPCSGCVTSASASPLQWENLTRQDIVRNNT